MKRSIFLKTAILLPLAIKAMDLNELSKFGTGLKKTKKQPVYFIGHGNPMNAIMRNSFTQHLEKIGKSFIEKPAAIIVVSAHWLTRGTQVTINENPKIIYDFGSFPDALYQVQYPAKGSTETAKEVKRTIKKVEIQENATWGLDHGAWTILKHIFPNADVPVIQLSIDATQPPQYHFELAKELQSLREKGVVIIGSGNIVHNLHRVNFDENALPFDWAVEFDEKVKDLINKRDFQKLVNYQNIGQSALLSIPTNEHYLPMLYTLGLAENTDNLEFTFEEIQNASISMRCFKLSN
jgi:4,5-DOPA dioxygenase extradiol